MSATDVMAEHRLLAILQCLLADADYCMNDVLLQSLLKSLGHGVSLAVLRADVAGLEQQRLVTIEPLPGCSVVKLRNAGVDVAKGLASVPGIARALPE